MVKQCVFWNKNGQFLAGFYFNFDNGNEYIISAEDGRIVPISETEKVKTMNYWVNLDYEVKWRRPADNYEIQEVISNSNEY